jgi:uncharacterized protein YbjT (DUF2867 family)
MTASRPYLVKISGLGTSIESKVDSGRWHAETEQQIIDSGLDYSFLRPLFFMQNLSFLFDLAKSTGEIRGGVGEAKIAMIDAEDIADVTAKLLVERNCLPKEAVSLTSSSSVTYQEVAALFSKFMGREVCYVPQSMSEVRQSLVGSDQPLWHQQILLQFNQAFIDWLG